MPPNFPDVSTADEDGLLMLGGELSIEWLLSAYSRGIFPWPMEFRRNQMMLAWFSPDPRAILELEKLHVPRRLGRRLRQDQFQFTINQAFAQVISACARRSSNGGDATGTWLTPDMIVAFSQLHTSGYAHSVEVWQEERLVGGLYGVALGAYFCAESMYHLQYDASKAAIVFLVRHLISQGFTLLDTQVWSPHVGQMGGIEISRCEFLERLGKAVRMVHVKFA